MVTCDKSQVSNIHVVGEFCLEENAMKRFPIGSTVSIEEYESNKKNHTFFPGVLEVYYISSFFNIVRSKK